MTRRCSQCGINYPTTVYTCRVCDGNTDLFSNDEPDPDWETLSLPTQAGDFLTGIGIVSDSQVLKWRLEELERAGFSPKDAWQLARSAHVDLHKALTLACVCEPALAFSILA